MTTLDEFVDEVRKWLIPSHGYAESDTSYRLRCPSGRCGDSAEFLFSRVNGWGICLNESLPKVGGYRRYSTWEIARLLGMDVYGLYGLFGDARPVNLPDTGSAMPGDSLRGLRTDTMDSEQVAQRLLEDPWILHCFLCLASASGIAGEGELLQTLWPSRYLTATGQTSSPRQPGRAVGCWEVRGGTPRALHFANFCCPSLGRWFHQAGTSVRR